MLFFLKTDLDKVFDLEAARAIKARKDAARAYIGKWIVARMTTRDITWVKEWTDATRFLVWDRIINTRLFRIAHPQQIMYPAGWEPLGGEEMRQAQAHQFRV